MGPVVGGCARLAPCTRLAGACANTNTLSLLPTSWGRGWNCALAFAVVAVMLLVTVSGKTGVGRTTLAVNVPVSVIVDPTSAEPVAARLPAAPSQVPT
jgi:hypothetical protein